MVRLRDVIMNVNITVFLLTRTKLFRRILVTTATATGQATSGLMMEAETVSKTLALNSTLRWLIALEDFVVRPDLLSCSTNSAIMKRIHRGHHDDPVLSQFSKVHNLERIFMTYILILFCHMRHFRKWFLSRRCHI